MAPLYSQKELEDILDLFVSLQPMKELKRQGAIYYGERMMEADTIAGHSFTVASLAWLLARSLPKKYDIDVTKVLKMALCHDMGEALTGDIGTVVKQFGRPSSGTDSLEQLESRAFARLVSGQVESEELTGLHEEYDAQTSREAGIVKVADRLDAWVHALNTPSVWPLIQAWCYYNKKTYEKMCCTGSDDEERAFWGALAAMFREACEALVGRTAILLNQDEKTFKDEAWPATR